jgi:3-hydroxyisobutyrate dehydrogenase
MDVSGAGTRKRGGELTMQIGWIGTGVMGRSMAGHLLDAGHKVRLHTRTRARAEPLLERGAVWQESASEVARACSIVFLMLGFPEEVLDVALGSGGVIESLAPGGILIDCSTSSPALAMEIAEVAGQRKVRTLDAPVSGGDIGARNATLSIMVGGDRLAFDEAMPLLEKLGKTIVYQGPAGSGQHAKMVNQILIASGMIAVCEGLIYARAAGLDSEKVLQSVSSGAAGSWSLSNYGPRMLKGDMAPGFYVEHFIKDMKIALDEADRMKLCLPGLALAKQLYTMVAANGGSRNGTQSLIKALEMMSART